MAFLFLQHGDAMKYASFASSPPVKSSLVGIVDVFFDRYRWLIVEDCERHDTDPRHIHHLFRGILGMWLRLRPFRAPWAWLGILSMRYSFLVVAWQMISLESACCAFCRPTLSLHRSMCCRFRNACPYHMLCVGMPCLRPASTLPAQVGTLITGCRVDCSNSLNSS